MGDIPCRVRLLCSCLSQYSTCQSRSYTGKPIQNVIGETGPFVLTRNLKPQGKPTYRVNGGLDDVSKAVDVVCQGPGSKRKRIPMESQVGDMGGFDGDGFFGDDGT